MYLENIYYIKECKFLEYGCIELVV